MHGGLIDCPGGSVHIVDHPGSLLLHDIHQLFEILFLIGGPVKNDFESQLPSFHPADGLKQIMKMNQIG